MSEENIKSFVTNQITLLKAKCEYKHLPSAIKEANLILDYSSMNNTNINTDINYLRAREGLDIDIKRSELPLRNEKNRLLYCRDKAGDLLSYIDTRQG